MSDVLVLNLGLKSIRAAVFSPAGERRAIAHRAIATQLAEGRVEQDPNDWWRAAEEVMDEVLATGDPSQIGAITATASAGCLVPMDAACGAVGMAIMISDVRAASQAELIQRLPLFSQLAQPPRRVTPDLMLPKILWLREHEPERYARARWFASPNDYLVARLTGEVLTDPMNASKYFHGMGGEGYPLPLLAELGLDADSLPPVAAGDDGLPVLAEIRERYRLPATCRVVLSTYDAICAVYGAGVSASGDACDVSGTVTSFRAVTDRVIWDPAGRLFSAPHVRDGLFLVGGSNNLGGGAIEWVKQLLYGVEADPYAAMDRDAADPPPGAGGITFLPYLLGERAPIWDASARAVFFGLGRNHRRSDLLRAVFEGVCYSVLDIAERLRELGIGIERVVASGGLARIEPILQIKADMLGVPVTVTSELESTALGAAILVGVKTGGYGSIDEAIRAAVRFGRTYEPVLERTEMYRDFFELYRGLYASLRDLFAEREGLLERHAEVLRTRPARSENL
jgi:sugar (pentulose or hexulose) kinase